MFRKLLPGVCRSAAVCHFVQGLLKIRIPACTAFHTELCSFFHQQLWLACAHMEYAVAAVVCLFLMLRCKQDGVDQFDIYGP